MHQSAASMDICSKGAFQCLDHSWIHCFKGGFHGIYIIWYGFQETFPQINRNKSCKTLHLKFIQINQPWLPFGLGQFLEVLPVTWMTPCLPLSLLAVPWRSGPLGCLGIFRLVTMIQPVRNIRCVFWASFIHVWIWQRDRWRYENLVRRKYTVLLQDCSEDSPERWRWSWSGLLK